MRQCSVVLSLLLTAFFLVRCQSSNALRQLAWQSANEGLPSYLPVVALAVDTADPNLLLAASVTPLQLYRSVNRGEEWQSVGDQFESRAVHSLLALAQLPGTFLAATSDGLLRSVDGGKSWRFAPDPPQVLEPPHGYTRLGTTHYRLLEAKDGTIYLTGERAHPWRSNDGGLTWQPLGELPGGTAILSLALAPEGETMLAGSDGAGLFRSEDRGASWQPVTAIPQTFVAGIWFDRYSSQIIYTRTRAGLFRSDDGGESWQASAPNLEARIDAFLPLSIPDSTPGQALFISNDGKLYRSKDGGVSWHLHGELGRAGIVYELRSWQQPEGERLLAATQHGLWESKNNGASWQHWARGPGNSPINDLTQAVDGTLFVAQAGGIYRASSHGAAWEAVRSGLPPVAMLSVTAARNNPKIFYAGSDGKGLFRSDDGGTNWQATPFQPPTVTGIVAHPYDAQHLWASVAFERLYESRDGGQSWQTPWNGLDLTTELIFLHISQSRPLQMFAGGTEALYRSDDLAQSWQPIAPDLAGQTLFALHTDPIIPTLLYAGTSKGAYRSFDGGKSWQRWGSGLEEISTTAILFHPKNLKIVFAGTRYNGLFASHNAGKEWYHVGLEKMSIQRLLLSSDSQWLIAATNHGVWRASLAGIVP